MPRKNVIRLIYGCQYRRALSVSSNVMSIRRTDKHCGARLVAAPATLHVAPLLFSPLPRVSSSYPSVSFSPALTLDADLPLSPDSAVCRHLQPFHPSAVSSPHIPVHIQHQHHYYNHRHRHHYRQPSLLLSNSIRGASALASSDSVVTRRAGILRFHQLPLLPAD